MKKVLVIAPYPYLPFFSGGQKFIAQFLESLGKKTDLTVISTLKNDESLVKGYTFLPLLKNSFSRYYDRGLIKQISAIVSEGGFDTVIWEHPYYAWLARRVREKTGTQLIIHTHNIEHQRFRSTGRWWWPILKRYEKRALKEADAVFFITPDDKQFAIDSWNIEPVKCIDVPFGIGLKEFPVDRKEQRNVIAEKHGIKEEEKIILFNGLLNYKPNLDALLTILNKINPLLLSQKSLQYKIIICGKGLPAEMNDLKDYKGRNIIYTGFVNDIIPYFKGADLFLNPVQSGGGIKTKMVESIAYGTTVISTKTGASGIVRNVCGDKLIVIDDNKWEDFADAILKNISVTTKTPAEFYGYYNWENVISNILRSLPHHSATAS
jgi:polysaccharide biosynthesis protein PslH